MVRIPTFIYICITMLVAVFYFQKYFTSRPPQYGVMKMMRNCIVFELIGMIFIAIFPKAMMLLICGTIAMGVYVILYYRHRSVKGEY